MKNVKRNTIFVLLIMLVVFYFIIKDDYKNILYNLSIANRWFLILSVLFILLYYLLKAICIYSIAKEHNKDIQLKDMLKQTLVTQFFNGITPFSTGGQPMQIYMLRNSGISVGSATNIIIQDFLMYQLALVTVGILALISNAIFHYFELDAGWTTLLMAGFLINTVIGLCLLFISFSKRFNDFIGKLIIKIGAKVRIIKDKEKAVQTWSKKLEEFNESAKLFKDKKSLLLKCYLFNCLALISYYIIPLFVFLSFNINLSISPLAVITSSAFVMIIGNFMPIPGGSVGIEIAFTNIFGSFLDSSLISSALIIWRFITYYFGVLIGGCALSFYKGSENKK